MEDRSSLISIIIPIFNCEDYLADTIDSVISQTYKSWELILIDDCSTDNSYEIARNYADVDSRIKLLQNKFNLGQSYSRNKGLDNCQGDYIAFLDSDDLWHPLKLEVHLIYSLKNNIQFSYSDFEVIDEVGFPLNIVIKPTNYLTFKKFLKYNSVGCLTIFCDRSILEGIRFAEDKMYQSVEDNIFLADIFRNKVSFGKIPKVLAYYRLRPNSSSARKLSMLKKRVVMLKNYFGIGVFERAWILIHYIVRNLYKYSWIKLLKSYNNKKALFTKSFFIIVIFIRAFIL